MHCSCSWPGGGTLGWWPIFHLSIFGDCRAFGHDVVSSQASVLRKGTEAKDWVRNPLNALINSVAAEAVKFGVSDALKTSCLSSRDAVIQDYDQETDSDYALKVKIRKTLQMADSAGFQSYP